MNKIEKLIKEFCPDGVEWKKLGEVCEIVRGIRVKKNDLIPEGKYPVVSGGTGYMGYLNGYNRDEKTITIAQYGTAGYVKWQEKKFWANDVCFCVYPKGMILNRYLYHFLLNKQDYLYKISNKSAIPYSISKENILKIKIPIPSLETQEKIVKILDNFTKYVTELQAKLQAELQARNKQYNYYTDMLLSEDYLNKISNKIFIQSNNVIHKTKLIEIAKLSRGKRLVRSELHENGQYPVFQNSLTPLGYYDNKNFDGGKTCIVTAGAAGEIFYQDRDFWAADDVLVITTDDILNKYLYYFLLNKQNLIKSKVRKASVPRLSRDDIEKIEVLLPPIEIQDKIVKILDRFQELLSDTKRLLPLEIEQRRKQYEYYREKLLTFDKEEGYALSTAQHSTAQRRITSKFFELLKEAGKVVGVDISDKVEWKTLGEISVGNLTYGSGASAIEYDGEVRYVRITDIDTNGNLKEEKFSPSEIEEKYLLNYGDILFARSGATVGKNYIHQSGEKSVYAGYLIRLIVNQKLALPQYIYHYINTTEYFKFVENTKSNGSQPNINAKQYSDFKIPLPPLPVQEYIVSILDKFDALVNDLSQGLPKEIELRQKQYEYYREKLLNFEK